MCVVCSVFVCCVCVWCGVCTWIKLHKINVDICTVHPVSIKVFITNRCTRKLFLLPTDAQENCF